MLLNGNDIQKKYDNTKKVFVRNGYNKIESILLSDFIVENNIIVSDDKLFMYKDDIKRLIKIYNGLYHLRYIYKDDFKRLQYAYNNKYINGFIGIFLNKYENNLDNQINFYENDFKKKLILRLSDE